jgi:hypothetical protein
VPPRYLCGNESSKQLTIYLRIDKEWVNITLPSILLGRC